MCVVLAACLLVKEEALGAVESMICAINLAGPVY